MVLACRYISRNQVHDWWQDFRKNFLAYSESFYLQILNNVSIIEPFRSYFLAEKPQELIKNSTIACPKNYSDRKIVKIWFGKFAPNLSIHPLRVDGQRFNFGKRWLFIFPTHYSTFTQIIGSPTHWITLDNPVFLCISSYDLRVYDKKELAVCRVSGRSDQKTDFGRFRYHGDLYYHSMHTLRFVKQKSDAWWTQTSQFISF